MQLTPSCDIWRLPCFRASWSQPPCITECWTIFSRRSVLICLTADPACLFFYCISFSIHQITGAETFTVHIHTPQRIKLIAFEGISSWTLCVQQTASLLYTFTLIVWFFFSNNHSCNQLKSWHWHSLLPYLSLSLSQGPGAMTGGSPVKGWSQSWRGRLVGSPVLFSLIHLSITTHPLRVPDTTSPGTASLRVTTWSSQSHTGAATWRLTYCFGTFSF